MVGGCIPQSDCECGGGGVASRSGHTLDSAGTLASRSSGGGGMHSTK